MKPIVTDTYDFPTLIKRGYVYVDKTALLRRLVSGVDGLFFFMSRPRRFGKSLMISTLEQIFKGEKDLFKGLAISKTDYDWTKYPVIRLDMTAFDHTSGLEPFKASLAAELGGTEPVAAFRALIAKKAKASRGKGVVVLIDEYDSPVSGLLGKPEDLAAMREFLQTFYRILKQEVASVRFLMMTGVSKFTKLSVFSGLNNLTDLTMDPVYAGLLGYTPDELKTVFAPQIAAFARESGRTPDAIIEDLLAWYDSYRFSPRSEVCVCNPVSIGLALKSKSFEAYWNRTGSSTLIIEHLRRCGKLPIDMERIKLPAKRLDVCDLQNIQVEALMYQGGYLTIKAVDEDGDLVLGIPNREVREAVYGGFLDDVLKRRSDDFASTARMVLSVLSDATPDSRALQNLLTSVFAMVPHEWKLKSEAEAKRYFLLFMKLVGADIQPESESSQGRADILLETPRAISIFEFKYGKSPRHALKQIAAKGYARPYAADPRRLFAIGVNYNPKSSAVEIAVETINSARETINENRETINETIKSIIVHQPGIKVAALVSATGKSRATVMRALSTLMNEGIVEYRGSKKTGGYYRK